jgi:hypothetical protein
VALHCVRTFGRTSRSAARPAATWWLLC